MKIKKIWANLAVSDLNRTTNFYTQLGFKSNGRSSDLTSFFVSDDNFIIHFFLKEKLEPSMGGPIADLKNGNEIIFSLSCESRNEIDQWVKIVTDAGGKIFSAPSEVGKGYTFGFSDPDGHKFNFLYWPA
ncbi:MAG: VOC family protein [Flavobacterium sp.]